MATSHRYADPGLLFVDRYGPLVQRADVFRYADFLRQEAGLGDHPPIDLEKLFRYFGLPPQGKAPLSAKRRGFLDPARGLIFVNSDDPVTRQRFSAAHELIEMLFWAQKEPQLWGSPGLRLTAEKERLCEEGAAALLMPLSTFLPLVEQRRVSLATGKSLAALYKVSLTAALMHAVQYGPGRHALVLWRLALKRIEKQTMNHRQMVLFVDQEAGGPPKKLRVLWSRSTPGCQCIPVNKSVEDDSSIWRCYEAGSAAEGHDDIGLKTLPGRCFCESMAVTIDGERHVLSVLHLPGDEHSAPPGSPDVENAPNQRSLWSEPVT